MSNKHHYKIQTDFFLGGVQLAKNDFCLVFNLVLQKNCSFQFGFSFTKLTVLSVFFPGHIRLSTTSVIYASVGMTLEMTNLTSVRAELVQLIVGWSDSELEVLKINTLRLHCWWYHVGRWTVNWNNVNNRPQTATVGSWKLNCGNWIFGFWILRSVQSRSRFNKNHHTATALRRPHLAASWLAWLVIERSRVWLPAGAPPGNNSGQVANTHVPLSPSSTIWYRPKGGDALWPGSMESHWPCGTDFSGLSTYGLTVSTERAMSTPPTLESAAWTTVPWLRSFSKSDKI